MIKPLNRFLFKCLILTVAPKRKNSSTTIYALASGFNQKCGVAVVRLSGKQSTDVLLKLTDKSSNDYEPRKMYLKNIWHPTSGQKIDKSMVVWFKGYLLLKKQLELIQYFLQYFSLRSKKSLIALLARMFASFICTVGPRLSLVLWTRYLLLRM